MTVVRIQEVLDISNRGIHDKRSDVIDVVMVSCSSSYPLSFIIMSTSQQNKEPNTQEPQKPWYEDRWFDEPLNLQFRKFEDKVRPFSLLCGRSNNPEVTDREARV